jgi:hypothetical protein
MTPMLESPSTLFHPLKIQDIDQGCNIHESLGEAYDPKHNILSPEQNNDVYFTMKNASRPFQRVLKFFIAPELDKQPSPKSTQKLKANSN